MKKLENRYFIGDSLIYRLIALYVCLNCLCEILLGYFVNWELFANVL